MNSGARWLMWSAALFGAVAAAALFVWLYLGRPGLMAYLDILTTPSGAALSIDGRSVGTAPLGQYKIKPGRHKIEADLPGYQRAAISVDLRAGQTLRENLELPPEPALLDIDTTPPRAALKIDDQPVGPAPLRRYGIEAGPHRIEASLAHYRTERREVSLAPGQEFSLDLSLNAVEPDVAGKISGVFSATRFEVGKDWVELYGVAQLAQNQHIQTFIRDITPAKGWVACYRETLQSETLKYQCYTGGKDLALLELKEGVVQPDADAPNAYKLAAQGQKAASDPTSR